MYCVRCGVKLREGTESCPLCGTPVWNPEGARARKSYPEELPGKHQESTLPTAVALTVLAVVAELVVLIVCLKRYGELRWGGYAMGGIALFYVLAVLPGWFRRPLGEVFIPADHAAIALYLLYVCLETGGNWFLSFAFPTVLGSCLLSTALFCLLKYVRGGKLLIFGGFLILLGGFCLLVELLEHITFGTRMFEWSLYALSAFGVVGIFLLISGIVPSMRQHLRKRFFY